METDKEKNLRLEIAKAVKEQSDKDYAIKLVEKIVFTLCAAILLGFVAVLIAKVGWK